MSRETDSWLDRLWGRLESRYGSGTEGCGCGGIDDAVRVLERDGLTPEELAAVQHGETSVAGLTAGADADLDPSVIDGLPGPVAELRRADDGDPRAGH